MISAVSCIDSVVWVTNASWSGRRDLERSRRPQRFRPDGCAAVGRVEATHRALDFRMPRMADQDHVAALARVTRDFHVHLGHQRTGGIEHLQAAPVGLVRTACETPCALKITVASSGTWSSSSTNSAPSPRSRSTTIAVVHDFVAHVDRRAEQHHRPLDDIDGAIDAGAEAARVGEQNLHIGKFTASVAGFAARRMCPSSPSRLVDQQDDRADGDGGIRDVEGREIPVAPVHAAESRRRSRARCGR